MAVQRGVVLSNVINTRDRTMRFVTIDHLAVNSITPLVGNSVNFQDKIDMGANEITFTDIPVQPPDFPNTVTMYCEDNGAGKTRLMVVFDDGTPQQLAIEP